MAAFSGKSALRNPISEARLWTVRWMCSSIFIHTPLGTMPILCLTETWIQHMLEIRFLRAFT